MHTCLSVFRCRFPPLALLRSLPEKSLGPSQDRNWGRSRSVRWGQRDSRRGYTVHDKDASQITCMFLYIRKWDKAIRFKHNKESTLGKHIMRRKENTDLLNEGKPD